MNSHDGFSKDSQMSDFIKIRPVRDELFHADGRKDRHDEADSRFSQFCERAYKFYILRAQAISVFCMVLRKKTAIISVYSFK